MFHTHSNNRQNYSFVDFDSYIFGRQRGGKRLVLAADCVVQYTVNKLAVAVETTGRSAYCHAVGTAQSFCDLREIRWFRSYIFVEI